MRDFCSGAYTINLEAHFIQLRKLFDVPIELKQAVQLQREADGRGWRRLAGIVKLAEKQVW